MDTQTCNVPLSIANQSDKVALKDREHLKGRQDRRRFYGVSMATWPLKKRCNVHAQVMSHNYIYRRKDSVYEGHQAMPSTSHQGRLTFTKLCTKCKHKPKKRLQQLGMSALIKQWQHLALLYEQACVLSEVRQPLPELAFGASQHAGATARPDFPHLSVTKCSPCQYGNICQHDSLTACRRDTMPT